jgi:hypothetical protein
MERTPRRISDYDAVMDPIRAARQTKSGSQPGDPAKAAQALLLGEDALGLVDQKPASMKAERDEWVTLSRSTSFAS